jgi:hypothetical protein
LAKLILKLSGAITIAYITYVLVKLAGIWGNLTDMIGYVILAGLLIIASISTTKED